MTTIYAAEAGGQYLVAAKGHATGSEQVCAGVSAIMYALAGTIKNNHCCKELDCKIQDGFLLCKFSGGREAAAYYELTVIGLKQIANSYPEYIEIVPKFICRGDNVYGI